MAALSVNKSFKSHPVPAGCSPVRSGDGQGFQPDSESDPVYRTPRLDRFVDLLLGHLVVALVALIVIGGATRVMQAGLACPDWPLCYGSLLPSHQMNLQVFLEWFHRLDAFLVGLALLTLAVLSLIRRRDLPAWLAITSGLSLLLVAVQGGLGALTVIGLLASGTVTAHLLTALGLLLLVSGMSQAMRIRSAGSRPPDPSPSPSWWLAGLLLSSLALLTQCGLGGAMASRWAATLCLQAGESCSWLLLHRLAAWGAFAALLVPAALARFLPADLHSLRGFALALALLAPLQVALGVLTFRLQLQQPLLTISHQLLAALLVALAGALWGRTLASSVLRPSPLASSLPAHG